VFLTKHADVLTSVCKNEAPYLEAKQTTIATVPLNAPEKTQEIISGASAVADSPAAPEILSPLNVGIENSRRFRALPVYAVLQRQGRTGFGEIFARQVRLARAVADYIRRSPAYQLLPWRKLEDQNERTHIVVLFRPKGRADSARMVAKKINETRRIYVTPTDWLESCPDSAGAGTGAIRLAVSNWMVDVEKDLAVISEVLEEVARDFASGS